MLLRRITKHVNEQNWFAVIIDFIIVVVGVFIGIQVANCNDSELRAQMYGWERLQSALASMISITMDEFSVIDELLTQKHIIAR